MAEVSDEMVVDALANAVLEEMHAMRKEAQSRKLYLAPLSFSGVVTFDPMGDDRYWRISVEGVEGRLCARTLGRIVPCAR